MDQSSGDSKTTEDVNNNNNINIELNNPIMPRTIRPMIPSISRIDEIKHSISEIIPNLYLTGAYGAKNFQRLEELKITHIVNCAAGDMMIMENERPDKYKYLHLRMKDTNNQELKKHIRESNEFIRRAIKKKGKVLLHCQMGVSRSASLLIAYLMDYHDMDYDRALALVVSKRSIVAPNSSFQFQLRSRLRKNTCCSIM